MKPATADDYCIRVRRAGDRAEHLVVYPTSTVGDGILTCKEGDCIEL